ncbi:MAG: glycosyltransferase family 4 protein [Magnetococcales bacterium]|nr:glycosyltransferase family 4 protein [Magnetococcales bacterium]
MNRVLMIAFHYPPALASGTQRTLSFSRDLPGFGWEPLILTTHALAHERIDTAQLDEIPPDILVQRALALDAARHLSIRGRYTRLTAWPDRWASWFPDAVLRGLYIILRHRPRLIWSTYPIPTALMIAHTLHRLTGLPWVADLRDPLVTGHHPRDPGLKKTFANLERKTVLNCTRIVVSTPGLKRFLSTRYPEPPADKWVMLPNGFDEKIFRRMDRLRRPSSPNPGPLTLVHGGTLYTGNAERNPGPLLNVVQQLRKQGVIGAPEENGPERIGLRILLRATSHDDLINAMIRKRALSDMVATAPPLPYLQALEEMFLADGLLLFQGESFNHLIPAKLFEYLRANRPILALIGAQGDSAHILRETGLHAMVPLEDEAAILPGFLDFLHQLRHGTAQLPDQNVVTGYSRRIQAKRLAATFDELTGAAAPPRRP